MKSSSIFSRKFTGLLEVLKNLLQLALVLAEIIKTILK